MTTPENDPYFRIRASVKIALGIKTGKDLHLVLDETTATRIEELLNEHDDCIATTHPTVTAARSVVGTALVAKLGHDLTRALQLLSKTMEFSAAQNVPYSLRTAIDALLFEYADGA